jgi:SAM-dependent methyltransferase
MPDRETLDVYDARATTYADHFARTKPDADLQRFIDAVPAGGTVLDLGCGPANSAAMMQAAGLVADAWDPSAGMIKVALETFGMTVQNRSFDDLDATDHYDGIWANFSLLHAPRADMPRHLAAIKTALKSGGVFHVGLKVGDDTDRDHLGRHYTYYTLDGLTELLTAAGLTVEFSRQASDIGLAGTNDPFMIVLARA